MQASRTAVSPVTVSELILKARRGLIPPLPSREGSFARYLEAAGFLQERFLWRDAEFANQLPPLHRDPIGRMLIGTAQRAGLTIIACDAAIRGYEVETVW